MIQNIIHIVLGKANPNRQNGVNKVVNKVASEQAKTEKNVQLWGISFCNKHNYPTRNYETLIFRDYKNKFKIDVNLVKAIHQINAKNTIVHIHGAFIPQFYSIAKILISLNISYVFTPHGGYNMRALEKSKWTKLVYINLFEKTIVNNAKAIQLLGASENVGTLKYFKAKKVVIIPNGQEKNNTLNLEPKKNNPKILKFGFLGRIDIKTKGLDLLINALSLEKNKEAYQLHIIGDGGEIETLKKMVSQKKLNDTVIFAGALFGSEKLTYINNLDFLCLTSRNEGLPGVVLEAASVGTPSLISTETNLGAYVNQYNSGWVMPQNTVENIKNTIQQISIIKEKNLLNYYSQNAIEMIDKSFSWSNISSQLKELYIS